MLAILDKYIIGHIMSKRDVLLAIHNYSELKGFAINAIIRSLLKFLIIRYIKTPVSWIACSSVNIR